MSAPPQLAVPCRGRKGCLCHGMPLPEQLFVPGKLALLAFIHPPLLPDVRIKCSSGVWEQHPQKATKPTACLGAALGVLSLIKKQINNK